MAKESPEKRKAWNAFSRYIRFKYADNNGLCKCVTCGTYVKWNGGDCHAGHYIGGRNNTVLFDERLVYPQCKRCNLFLDGNYRRFALYMLGKGYKVKQLEEFESLKNKTRQMKPVQFKEIELIYKNKLKLLEREKCL